MTATTMHFGPEWMRPKHSSRPQNPPSPPPTISQASPGMSSYSSLVTPNSNTPQEKPDIVNPFRYSKEDLLRIYKERGGQSGLGLEVERWEGVVREVGNDPIAMKEWDEAEKKLFAGPLNSEVRRRQSSDYLSSPLAAQSAERNKLMRDQSGTGSPMRERFGNLIGRRREGSDQPPLTIPRKLSLSTTQNAINSSRDGGLSSPRSRGPLTPGFDGVLNVGESWTSRRKKSESGSKTGTYSRGDGEPEPYDKGHEIREEEEEHSTDDGRGQNPSVRNALRASGVAAAMDNLSLKDGTHPGGNDVPVVGTLASGQNPGMTGGGRSGQVPDVTHPPPGIADLANIEWSYLDPQGQIQGPFRADTMQKWYDGGYFSSDLLMKRTHLDHDWTSVGELARRATGEKLFLSPIVRDQAPPGLSRPTEASLDSAAAASGFTAPYQPVPLRSIHTAALDPYFASGSTASNSPSSSFGVGRFGESPDPAALAGRVGGHVFPVSGSPGGSRNGFMAEPPTFSAPRRAGFNDSPYDAFPMRSGFSNAPAVGTPSIDGFGLGSQTLPSHNLWPAGTAGRTDVIDSTGPFTPSTIPGVDPAFASQTALSRGFANGRPQNDGYGGPFGGSLGAVNQRDLSRLGTRDPFLHEEKRDHPGGAVLGEYTNGLQNPSPYATPALSQAYSQSPSMQYASPQAPAQVPPIVTSLGPSFGQPTMHAKQPTAQQPRSATQSRWGVNGDNVPRRPAAGPGPFDQNVFPTVSNTTSARTAPPQSSSWARTTQGSIPASVVDEQSPWHAASQSIADDGWGPAHGPTSLTVDNLGQHNQQQEQEEALHKHHDEPTEPVVEQAPLEAAPVLPTPDATPPAPSKARRPSTTRLAPTPTTAPSPPQEAKSPSTASSAVPAKPVWSTVTVEEEKKVPNATPSLREIQEAETKKQEARKAAERERERAARAAQGAAPTPAEEAQSFTASWGLPTSKVGSSRSIPTVKDTMTSTPATSVAANSPAPVWTNGTKPQATKKTMKEIQEEEERRKKLAAKDTVAAAAARRAYAETTTKSPQPSQSAGIAWTTVGSNGKSSIPAATTAVRPAVTPSASSAAVAPVRATSATPAARPVVPAAVKAAPVAAKVEETPIAPSTDFMKWLTDSLKGLNSSVNFEEIMSMLLTFPLDVDSTTKEIISELIYANSTTLDGRRFAEEFVSKRKADAASRKGAGKQPSIADVLKAQPKPSQQSEWGGFKVVNKKKKGGRV
ncbi:hypothetical protein EWM64_g4380 [Hericium alpestre]|uniref:GYF domain-containing protein n=1 Tax=Hericium alpestre TaxID=135208 RepID=A0A4Y9ZZP0_9AGAM|nr:hypothetical protein EWM64_g4380 [Hericium alpestre]